MKRRLVTAIVIAACAFACLFALGACGSSDSKNFIGEWRVKDTQVTVVFNGSEWKLFGNTFDYTVDSSNKTISYKAGNAEGKAKYAFSDNNKVLTLEEDNGMGGTKVTVFERLSDNGNAEPSAGITPEVPSEGM